VLSEKGADERTAFDAFADALLAAGVRRIEGRLVGHEGLFKDRRAEAWEWSDLVWCYGAEVSALAWNDNCATLEVAAGERVGDPAVVERSPLSRYYSLVSDATTSPAGTSSDLRLERELGSNAIHLSGTQPIGAKPEVLDIALEDPARYATTVLAEVLEARGIRISRGIATSSDPLPAGVRELAAHDSPPLAEILKAVNKPSNNLQAEMLRRLVGVRAKREGSLAASLEAMRDFATRVGAPGLASSLQDGSGLARTNMLRPEDIALLLVAMNGHAHAAAFRESLPVAGVDGTLEHRLRGTAAERRVQAKTGTLRQTSALAGYATNKTGDRFVFSIVLNHNTLTGREAVAAIDQVVALLAN
jgi:PBP4 family serine-type D-alanyl-D-alanine carboxypeptidase